MKTVFAHLKFRTLAAIAIAVVGSSSAAASRDDMNVQNFRSTSPNLRPQTPAAIPVKPITIQPQIVNTTSTEDAIAPAAVTPAPITIQPVAIRRGFVPYIAPTAAPTTVVSAPAPAPAVVPASIPIAPVQAAAAPIAEPNSQTQAGLSGGGICPYPDGRCFKGQHAAGLDVQSRDMRKIAQAAERQATTTNTSLLNKLSIEAVRQAMKPRSVARFCGGGVRSGNRSKCACAAGVKDALLSSGACASRPGGDAVNLAGLPHGTTRQLSGTGPVSGRNLAALCPAFHQIKGRFTSLRSSLSAAENAPAGSVIVYSTSRHGYGHIETKIKVTQENYAQISRMLKVRIGQDLYCSDFCRTGPTFSHGTNRVEGIYSL